MGTIAVDLAVGSPARLRRRSALAVGGSMLGLLVLVALVGPSPVALRSERARLRPAPPGAEPRASRSGRTTSGGTSSHAIVYGAAIDLRIGVLAVVFPFLAGSILGAVAGYRGGWIDAVIMRTVDVITAVPFLVLVIAIVAFLGPGEVNVLLAIGAVGWVTYARLVRGEVLREKNLEYAAALRALGFGAGGFSWGTSCRTPSRRRSSSWPPMSCSSSSPRPRSDSWGWACGPRRPSGE